MAAPFLIFGLGNPGAEYAPTRHNAGFWFLQRLAGGKTFKPAKKLHSEALRLDLAGCDCLLLKPVTYVNCSGQAVRAAIDWYKLPPADWQRRMLVVHDDLDIPPGQARLKCGGGHGGHNGLRDIDRHLGTSDYLRLRIGVGHPGTAGRVTAWLIRERVPADELELVEQAFERSLDVLPLVLGGDLEQAMNRLHTAA